MFLTLLFLTGCQGGEIEASPSFEPVSSETLAPSLTPNETKSPTLVVATVESTSTATRTLKPSFTPTPTLFPGATQISPSDGAVLVYIPAGEFLMGSTETDIGADYDELPQHIVNLDAYWIGQTVVTNVSYAGFLNEMGNQTEGRTTWLDAGDEDVLIFQSDGSWQPSPGFENHPVVEVTWYGAQAYCQWVGGRLPTEAEWEKAARGPFPPLLPGEGAEVRAYPWGDDIDCDHAQYANCGGKLLPAESKPAGASYYGVLGLSGNAWEWVADWYAADFYATSSTENPTGAPEGETRVLRGGSWEYDWKHLRAANRRHNGPAVSMHDYGFRCVMDDGTK